jgi:polysaccharide deacetylase family sporulation protein PdaB
VRKTAVFVFGAFFGALALGSGLFVYRKLNRVYNPPTYELRDDILVHGNVSLKEVALTFDDGPRPEHVRPILDLLGRENVKATFFVVGKKVEENPRLVRRMMKEGHEVGNHTYSHPRLDGLTADQIREEIANCARSVEKATGAGMNLFRPPGMRYDDTVIRTAQDLGYVTIHWNAAAHDFKPQAASEVARKVLKSVQPGSVILLHNHPDTVAALPEIIAELKRRGYRFVRVSQMLGRLPRPVFANTNAYGVKNELVAEAPKKAPPRIKRAVVKRAGAPPISEPGSDSSSDRVPENPS